VKAYSGKVMIKLKYLILISMLATSASLNAQPIAAALADATDNGDGTFTNWFGTFSPETAELASEGFINHTEHGRLYVAATGEDLWLYDANVAAVGDPFHGWIYTNRSLFPYFVAALDPLIYLIYVEGVEGPSLTPRVFLNAASLEPVLLPRVTTQTVVDIAVASDDFSSLETAVVTANLAETLSSEGPFTVFAPTDAAFGELDAALLNDLLTNPDSLPALTNILTYHVVAGRVTSGNLGLDLGAILRGEVINGYVETVNGSTLRIEATPFGIMINGSTMVDVADIEASNGIIHVIDSVLLPPSDIVDTAVSAGFDTLVAAVQAANLESALRAEGPYTVFAPTQEAFAALGEETLNNLLNDPDTLGNILLYHVVDGDIYASEVAPGPVTMLNGDVATISLSDEGGLMIEGANIIATDVTTSNGVIHVIDSVILPPGN